MTCVKYISKTSQLFQRVVSNVCRESSVRPDKNYWPHILLLPLTGSGVTGGADKLRRHPPKGSGDVSGSGEEATEPDALLGTTGVAANEQTPSLWHGPSPTALPDECSRVRREEARASVAANPPRLRRGSGVSCVGSDSGSAPSGLSAAGAVRGASKEGAAFNQR